VKKQEAWIATRAVDVEAVITKCLFRRMMDQDVGKAENYI
jgi:hypothetical protein